MRDDRIRDMRAIRDKRYAIRDMPSAIRHPVAPNNLSRAIYR